MVTEKTEMTTKSNIVRLADKALCLAASALAMLAVSCSGDDITGDGGTKKPENEGKTKTVTLTATVGADADGSSRVGMSKGEDNSTATFYWHKGDSILVQTEVDGKLSTAILSTDDADGTREAAFSGDIDEAAELGKYAVYPYSDTLRFTSEKALLFTLPNTYENYKPESNIFSKTVDGITTYPANSTNVPLLGTIDGNKISFRHLCGLAVIRIDKMPAESGTLKITADQRLAASFKVADVSAENAEIVTEESLWPPYKNVTFNFVNATKGAVGVFYLPLATGNYTNVTVTLSADGGETKTASCGSLSISRADVTSLALNTNSKGDFVRYCGNGKYLVNGHVFVDLGTSVLWAETNVEPTEREYYCACYMWGETVSKFWSLNSGNYKWTSDNGSTFTRYNTTDGLTTLKDEDDVARVKWGSPCRMPTKSEMEELGGCTWTKDSATYYEDETYKIVGYTVSGKNGHSIFIPCGGYIYESSYIGCGEYCYLWTNTLSSDGTDGNCKTAWHLRNSIGRFGLDTSFRWYGMPVRPVIDK